MVTITEDYVSFEIAKLLKEKGFNEPCLMCYTSDKKLGNYGHYKSYKNSDVFSLTAPTIQMAMKWLREEKRTSIIIEFDLTKRGYNPYVYQPDYDMDWVVKWRRNLPMKYEEACEAALKYTIENLI